MAWQMPGQWNPGVPQMTPDLNMGSYTPEQWAIVQQQNWQQWTQWQQQYSQWQTQYGEKYAQQMQAMQMGMVPPLPPSNAAPPPAPPPPSEQPPPPPHENNQPLFGQPNPVPAPGLQQQVQPTGSSNNVNIPTGNTQNWQQGTESAAQPTVNAEALKKLAEEERLFDIQFQKWEEEIEKWKRENVNHPDRQAYREYEQKFETCRAQLLERRQVMKQKRARLLGQSVPAAGSVPTGNSATAHPPMQTTNNSHNPIMQSQSNSSTGQTNNQYKQNDHPQNNYRQNNNKMLPQNFKNMPPQNYSDNSQYAHAPYNNKMQPQGGYNRSNNKNVDPQDRFASYDTENVDDYENQNVEKQSYSTPISSTDFLPGSGSAKSIPGLDLVPEVQESQQPDVIDITDEKTTAAGDEVPPDYTTISKGINSILGDEKIMNILNMVRDSVPPAAPNKQGPYGQNPSYNNVTNTPSGPQSNQWDRNQVSTNQQYSNAPPNQVGLNQQYSNAPPNQVGLNQQYSNAPPNQVGLNQQYSNAPPNQVGPNQQYSNAPPNQVGPNQQYSNAPPNQVGPNQQYSNAPPNQVAPNQQYSNAPPNMSFNRQGSGYPDQTAQQYPTQTRMNNDRDNNIAMNQYNDRNVQAQNMHARGPPPMRPNMPNMSQPRPLMQDAHGYQDNNDYNRRPPPRGVDNMGPMRPNMPPIKPLMECLPGQGNDNDYSRGPNDNRRMPNSMANPVLNTQVAPPPQVPPQPSRPKWNVEPLFTPSIIVEYEHKPLRLKAREFIEPVHMFDYNHKSKDGENKKKDFEREADELFERKPRRYESEDVYRENRFVSDDAYRENRFAVDRENRFAAGRDNRFAPERENRFAADRDNRFAGDRENRFAGDRENRFAGDRENRFATEDREHTPRDFERRYPREELRRDDYRDFRGPPREEYDDRRRPDERHDDRRRDDRDRYARHEDFSRDRGRDRDDANRDRQRDLRRDDTRNRSRSRDIDTRKRGRSRESTISESSSIKKAKEPEKKEETPKHIVMIDDLLEPPGREMRPEKIVIILRGPPGSGKSYLAKLIRDREAEYGGTARIMSIDDYFMLESEVEEKDPTTGKIVKKPSLKYEYEAKSEETYLNSLKRAFKRSLTDGYFNFLIYDAINDTLRSYADIWNFARQQGFQVYICTMELDSQICFKRNIHGRTLGDIQVVCTRFFPTPDHHIQLDATTLLQSGAITEVQMEDIDDEVVMEDVQDPEVESSFTSKWEKLDDAAQLARLDGTSKPLRPSQLSMEDYLQLDDWKPTTAKPGKKTVRWADIEESRQQEKMRAIGFVVGQTDWNRMTDPTKGSSALTQTKYIERVRRN